MKLQRSIQSRPASGACLVEVFILVVIVVLVIGMLMPGILPARHAAERSKAASDLQSLCSAAKVYKLEYEKWPEPMNAGDLVLTFNGLMNPRTDRRITDGQAIKDNPRAIQFMEFKLKDVTLPRSNAQSPLALYDPWATPYAYCFDNGKNGSYYLGPLEHGIPSNLQPWPDAKANDNQIPMPFKDDSSNSTVISGGYAFFSNGPDGRTGTGRSDPANKNETRAYEDDIRSWK